MTSKSGGANVEIRFYGGIEGSIGGNAVVLTVKKGDKSFNYLFDCGINLQKYFRHRRLGGRLESLDQLQRWGFLPEFEGIGEIRACFISHGHNDHWFALPALEKSTLAPRVIWTSRVTRQFMGLRDLSITEKPLSLKPFEYRNFYYDEKALRDNVKITVAPFPVDHSIPGSCAYLIEIEDRIIVYTGDFRDHGLLSAHMKHQQFWHYVKQRSQDKKLMIICEGTNYGTPHRFSTEEHVKNRLEEILKNYKNEPLMIIINEKDLWRMLAIQHAVEDVKIKEGIERRIIYCDSTARLLKRIYGSFRSDYKGVLHKSHLEKFARSFMIGENQILSSDLITRIVENPQKYMLVATRREGFNACDSIANKMKYKGVGGCCVLSLSETLEEEMGVSTREYTRSVAELGFDVEEVHSSGHIYPTRLIKLLSYLDPECVFILHTSAPQGLQKFIRTRTGIKAISPKLGVPEPIFC